VAFSLDLVLPEAKRTQNKKRLGN